MNQDDKDIIAPPPAENTMPIAASTTEKVTEKDPVKGVNSSETDITSEQEKSAATNVTEKDPVKGVNSSETDITSEQEKSAATNVTEKVTEKDPVEEVKSPEIDTASKLEESAATNVTEKVTEKDPVKEVKSSEIDTASKLEESAAINVTEKDPVEEVKSPEIDTASKLEESAATIVTEKVIEKDPVEEVKSPEIDTASKLEESAAINVTEKVTEKDPIEEVKSSEIDTASKLEESAATNVTEKVTEKDPVEGVKASEIDTASKPDEPATTETPSNETNGTGILNDTSKSTEENVDNFIDVMMKNLQENFNQDVDSIVSLMESAEEFMFESDDKQLNIKTAIQTNKNKEYDNESVVHSEKSEAYSLLAQGKRNLFVKDYESAVTTLGEACQKLSSIYGDFAVELADAYLTYGNALLELWRVEEADKKNNEDEKSKVLGNVQEEPEDDQNDEENDDEKNNDDSGIKSGEKETEEDDEDEECEKEEKNEDAEEDIENEEDNLQIAWEVVELAKEIYIRHNDNVNLAKAYLKLGEISITSGNYLLSIEDLNRSLEIQKNVDPVDNRLKANTHFNLYVAYSASHNYDKSAEHLDTAKSVFETQVDDLSQKLKIIDKSNTAEITKITKEIGDTEEIIRDMDSKVLENFKHKREFMTALVDAIKNKTAEQSFSGSGESPCSNKLTGLNSNLPAGSSSSNLFGGTVSKNVPVNNINNLIRKKPKDTVEPAVDAKNKQNGTVTVNGKASLEKTVPNSNSESSALVTATNIVDKQDDEESNDRKRKATEPCEPSPKKPCLENE